MTSRAVLLEHHTSQVLNSNIKILRASFIPVVVAANVPCTMSSDDTKPFRERLRMLREARGLSQTKLEERIGKEANYITRVETGRIVPPLDVIVRIAHEFDMSVNDLFLVEGIDDSPEVLRAKIHRLVATDDVKRLRKYYRLLLVSDEE
jgi:transcriptional regulator with XRE-family HTH domain